MNCESQVSCMVITVRATNCTLDYKVSLHITQDNNISTREVVVFFRSVRSLVTVVVMPRPASFILVLNVTLDHVAPIVR